MISAVGSYDPIIPLVDIWYYTSLEVIRRESAFGFMEQGELTRLTKAYSGINGGINCDADEV